MSLSRKYVCLAVFLAVAAPAQELPVRPSGQSGPFIDLRARVDGTADFLIQGSRIRFENRSGRQPTDEGSEYGSPLPGAPVSNLRVDKRDGRGRISVVEQPSIQNGFTLRLRIDDPKGGDDRYHARITWSEGGGTAISAAPEPEVRIEELSATAAGRGYWRGAGRDEGLTSASLSLIPSGRAILSFPGLADSRIEGTWAYAGRREITMTIAKAMGVDATGQARIRMRGDRFQSIELEASAAGKGDVRARFDQAGEYKDFVNPGSRAPIQSGRVRAPRPPVSASPSLPEDSVRAPRPPAPVPSGRVRAPRPGGRAPVRGASAPRGRITELSRSFAGEGYLDASRIAEDEVKEVFIRLRDDGQARLELEGEDEYWTVEGRWSHNGSDTVTIGLTRIGSEDASGAARLGVQRKPGDQWEVLRIEIDGESRRTGKFQVRMRIRD